MRVRVRVCLCVCMCVRVCRGRQAQAEAGSQAPLLPSPLPSLQAPAKGRHLGRQQAESLPLFKPSRASSKLNSGVRSGPFFQHHKLLINHYNHTGPLSTVRPSLMERSFVMGRMTITRLGLIEACVSCTVGLLVTKLSCPIHTALVGDRRGTPTPVSFFISASCR